MSSSKVEEGGGGRLTQRRRKCRRGRPLDFATAGKKERHTKVQKTNEDLPEARLAYVCQCVLLRTT
jgi:hypothetical protein